MEDSRRKIIVIVPCYNEFETLGSVLEGVRKQLKGYFYSIIVIDDGSTDGTDAVARSCNAEVVSHPYNLGLAQAFRTGCKRALEVGADIIIHIDGDGQYEAAEISELLPKIIRKEADLVLGWREHIERMPITKRAGNWLLSRAVSFIARRKINDAATGFRCFTADVARMEIISNFTYTAEQVIRAFRSKRFRVAEVPVRFYARKSGGSRLFGSTLSYAAQMGVGTLRLLRDFSPLRFFGAVGLLLIASGIAVGLILGHDLTSLGLFLVGINVLALGFISDSISNKSVEK